MIVDTIVDVVILHIQMAETLVEVWATLKDLYKIDNTTRILLLQHQLYTLELDEGGNVHDHITKVKVVRD